jgi:hypothetical protein
MSHKDLISVGYTEEEISMINEHLTGIEQIIQGKVVNLSPEERQQYGRINDRTENWVVKVKDYMVQKPELIPFYIDQEEHMNDIEARDTMKPFQRRINSIKESFDDTSKLLSHDIYNTSIAYYRNMKIISQQDIPGTTTIYEDLRSQFPGRPSTVPEEAEK